jgi:hypothetical protein
MEDGGWRMEDGGWIEMENEGWIEMENEGWMFEERFYESTSQYNWASFSAVGRNSKAWSADKRKAEEKIFKFSTAFSSCLLALPVVLPNITEYTVKQELELAALLRYGSTFTGKVL